VSLEFLAPDAAVATGGFAPVARSPMERSALAAGARCEVRDGWSVAVGYSALESELEAARSTGGWADLSHLSKLEIQASEAALPALVAHAAGDVRFELGWGTHAAGAWWLPCTRKRVMVVCEPAALPGLRERLVEAAAAAPAPAGVVEVTTAFAALAILGPAAREIFARFTAIDLRPGRTPVSGFRPGSVARTPGMVLREGEQRYLMLFGAALGEYMWTVVEDAGRHLGAVPLGLDALARLEPSSVAEAASHA
jgi:heterotetrameric sarcosine oxidase gamma subunit